MQSAASESIARSYSAMRYRNPKQANIFANKQHKAGKENHVDDSQELTQNYDKES